MQMTKKNLIVLYDSTKNRLVRGIYIFQLMQVQNLSILYKWIPQLIPFGSVMNNEIVVRYLAGTGTSYSKMQFNIHLFLKTA